MYRDAAGAVELGLSEQPDVVSFEFLAPLTSLRKLALGRTYITNKISIVQDLLTNILFHDHFNHHRYLQQCFNDC